MPPSPPPAGPPPAGGPAGEGAPARRLGERYRVKGRLGSGGMADVFRATDRVRGEDVAVKVLKPALGGRREHITSEFRFIAGLRHPGIVRVFDYGLTEADEPFFTMELCEGPDLYAYSRQVDARGAILALRQAVATLGFVHARGIVHADLKPSNILMGRAAGAATGGEGGLAPRLLDFGIAWEVERGVSDRLGGTAHFMAPEAADGVRSVGTDLYALGVVLFQLLTGRFPFQGDNVWDLLDAHLHQPPPDPRTLAPDAPPALCELALRLLEKSPADRPSAAAEVVAALDAWLGGEAADFAPEAAALAARAEPRLVGRDEPLRILTVAATAPPVEVDRRGPGGDSPLEVFVVGGPRGAGWPSGAGAAEAASAGPSPPGGPHRGAGLGKTRLLQEVRVSAQLAGVPTVAIHLEPGEPARATLRRLELALAGVAGPSLLPLRPPVGPHGGAGLGLLARAQRLGDLLSALVSRRGRALLLIDDLHRASPEGAHVLLAALQRGSRPGLRVVVSVGRREGGAWAVEQGLGELGAVTRLELRRLSREDLAAAVTSVLGDVRDLDLLVEQLLDETGGDPGAAVAALRAWLTVGALVPGVGGWRVSAHLQGRLPQPRAEGALSARVDAQLQELEPALREVAIAASVLGDAFDRALLDATVGRDTGAALQSLVRKDLVEPRASGAADDGEGGRRYRFVQAAVRRELRRRAAPEDVRRWALGATDALARRRGRGEAVDLEQLASLLAAAGGGMELIEVACAAARELVSTGEAARGVEVLAGAVDAVDGRRLAPSERPLWAKARLRLGELAARVGDMERVSAALEPVLEARDATLEPLVRAARRQRGALMLARGEGGGEEGEALLRAVRDEARAAGDHAEWARAALALAHHYAITGRQPEAAELAQEAARASELSGDPLLTAQARKEQGTVAWYGRDLEGAAAAAREAARAMEEAGDPKEIARAYGLLGNVLLDRRELQAAEEAFERARHHAEAGGWLVGVSMVLNSLAQVRHHQMDWEGARELWLEARKIDDLTGLQVERCVVRNNLGVLALQRGAYEEARTLLDEALSLATGAGMARERARTLGNLGELHRRTGARGAALRALDEARGLAQRVGQPGILLEVETSRLALDLQAPSADLGDVIRRARALLEDAAAQKAQDERVKLELLLARALARRGRHAEARGVLASALDRSAVPGSARADIILTAAELDAQGVPGLGVLTARLQEAVRVAQRLRARPLIDRARRLGLGSTASDLLDSREDVASPNPPPGSRTEAQETPVGQGDKRLGAEAWPRHAEHPDVRFDAAQVADPKPNPGVGGGFGATRPSEEEGRPGLTPGGPAAPAPPGPEPTPEPGEGAVAGEQGRLLALIRELGEIEDLDELLGRVVDEARSLVGAERGFVVLVDEAGRGLVRVARPAGEPTSPELARLSRTVVERALRGRGAITYRGGAEVAPSVSAAALGRAITALPLRWRGRAVGVLYLDGPLGREPGTGLSKVEALAVHLAALVRNAWLLEEQRRRADTLLTVAQELVHPLTAILGYAALLEASGVRPHQAGVIRAQARRAAAVLEHLVEVGQLEGRELAWTMVSVQVKDLVFSAAGQVEPMAGVRGVRVRADVAAQLPTVWGNRDRLVQALATLLAELVSGADRGDCVEVSARVGPRAALAPPGTGATGARRAVREVGVDGEPPPPLSPDRVIRLVARCVPTPGDVPAADVRRRSSAPDEEQPPPATAALVTGGVGRALAERIVARHGGHLEVREGPDGEAVATIELPTLA